MIDEKGTCLNLFELNLPNIAMYMSGKKYNKELCTKKIREIINLFILKDNCKLYEQPNTINCIIYKHPNMTAFC